MSDQEKALWLKEHYHDYNLSWYLTNPKRLDAIFKREYSKSLKSRMTEIKDEENRRMESQIHSLETAYLAHYHVAYQQDLRDNRRKAFEQAQAIRHLWSGVAY